MQLDLAQSFGMTNIYERCLHSRPETDGWNAGRLGDERRHRREPIRITAVPVRRHPLW